MSSRLNKPDTTADKQVRECIEQKKSFIMTAGAGSGKTTSLIKALNFVLSIHKDQFKLKRKKIACITYTNVAAEEIWKDVGEDPIVHVSTIHSFLWTLIQPFQTDIRKWILDNLDNIEGKITDLKEHNKKDGTKAETKKKKKNEDEISRLKNDMKAIVTARSFSYSSTGSNYNEGMLGHDDIIKLCTYFINNKPLFRKIVALRFPFIFVDEYQDTKPDIVDGLISINAEIADFCLGFFGDPMQKIYTDGVGEITNESLEEITKEENFRSSKHVLNLANNISQEVNGLRQKARVNVEEGQAHLFILPVNEDRDRNLKKVHTFMAKKSNDEQWNYSENDETKVKILVLVHRSAAKRLGFPKLYSALNDKAPSEFKTMVKKAEGWVVDPFLKDLLPLHLAYSEGRSYEVISSLRRFSPALKTAKATNDTEKADKPKSGAELAQTLNKLKKAMDKFSRMFSHVSNSTIRDLLNFTKKHELLEIDKKFYKKPASFALPHTDEDIKKEKDEKRKNKMKNDNEKRKNEIMVYNSMQAFLNSPAKELLPYYNYKLKESPFSTQHGIKGAEFDRVLVVLDDEESKYNLFSYEKYFGLKDPSKSKSNKDKEDGKEPIEDKTRRLFYVCCTRAKKDLAVVLFTRDPDAKKKIAERKLFERDNIHTEEELDKALEKQDGPAVESQLILPLTPISNYTY